MRYYKIYFSSSGVKIHCIKKISVISLQEDLFRPTYSLSQKELRGEFLSSLRPLVPPRTFQSSLMEQSSEFRFYTVNLNKVWPLFLFFRLVYLCIPRLVGAVSWDPCDWQRRACCGRHLHWLSWQHLAWTCVDAVSNAATLSEDSYVNRSWKESPWENSFMEVLERLLCSPIKIKTT